MKKIDLKGQKFDRLLVLEEIPKEIRNHIKPVWKCRCDCGNEIWAKTDKLKNSNTKSCGCLRREKSAERLSEVAKSQRKYEPKEATARNVFRSYNDGDISFDFFYNDLSQQSCFYCDRQPFYTSKYYGSTNTDEFIENCAFTYNGLDRLDNTKPHNIDNIITCCKDCNTAKNTLTPKAFYNHIQNLHHNLRANTIDALKATISITNKENIQEAMVKHGLFKNGKPTRTKTIYYDGVFSEYDDDDIDFHSFYYLTQLPCAYCLGRPSNFRRITNDLTIYHSGLDRINSSLPHSLDNVLPSCKWCNFTKGTKSFDEFKELMALLYEHFTIEKVEYLEKNFVISEPINNKTPLKPRVKKRYPKKPKEPKFRPPGSQPGMVGYKFPEEIKQKMSTIAQATNRSKGEKNPKATITEAQAIEIKKLLQSLNPRQTSEQSGIALRTVRRIAYGETWTHIKV